jgi:hypothetical protein
VSVETAVVNGKASRSCLLSFWCYEVGGCSAAVCRDEAARARRGRAGEACW